MADLTPPEHSHSEAVEVAARWYATQPRDPNRSGVIILREHFNLTPLEACEALALARLINVRAL
ncbi:hypothetical protein [Phyllobacterium sp. K27]